MTIVFRRRDRGPSPSATSGSTGAGHLQPEHPKRVSERRRRVPVPSRALHARQADSRQRASRRQL